MSETPAEKHERQRREQQRIQRQLDEALADSFPASDPVSIVTSHAEEDWGGDAPAENAEQTDPPVVGKPQRP